MDGSKRTRESYDEIATAFLASVPSRDRAHAHMDRFEAALPERGLILDVGAGPGYDAAELHRRGLPAIALDYSAAMLRVAVPPLVFLLERNRARRGAAASGDDDPRRIQPASG